MTRQTACTVLGALLAIPAVAWAQSTEGAQAATGQATQSQSQPTRAGTTTGTSAQSDSSDWQEAGKTGTSTGKDTDAPARDRQAATTGDDFDALDTDHDGRLSRAEAGASQQVGGRFKTLDADGDGYVSNSEYREGLRATRTPTTTP